MNRKKFTILHSNDMHGDFLAEVRSGDSKMIGGLALLSGYVNKVRREEENVLYVISGDMVQGSIIDTEYKGISTIEIMNYLAPDVVTLGNHEFDYGLPHLLFLEKLANFPIVNANLFIKDHHKRLMQPYVIINKAGFDFMFIGVITDKVIDALKTDQQVGSFISLQEATAEIGHICNAYKNDDIDLTVLLTHIGFDSDCELAKLLNPAWGVDMIIGGHSHTILEQPENINNIMVAQAGVGTDQIGRFDIVVDDDTNSIVECNWELIPITSAIAEPDQNLQTYIDSFKEVVDRKYNAVLSKFSYMLTHPKREQETALGNLTADAVADSANADVVLIGSGSIRQEQLGPLVTLGNFISCYPYDDSLTRVTLDGGQLRRAFNHWMRIENRDGEGECYQVNAAVRAIYDESAKQLASLRVNGEEVVEDKPYTLVLQGYHLRGAANYLALPEEEVERYAKPKLVSTSLQDVLEEYLRNNQNACSVIEGRLVYQ